MNAAPRDARDDLVRRARSMRRLAVGMIYHARSGHPGGSLSAVDLLAHLYFRELRLGDGATDPDRDRLIVSKGHAAPALYAAWILRGWLPESSWPTLRKLGSPLQGHPDVLQTPWCETSTGSLGQGFSVGVGMALGLRHQRREARVHVLLGDGELQEGQVWEAAMLAGHQALSNLCVVIDYNKLQSDDWNRNIVGLEPLVEKWQAFGWHAVEVDGHDHGQLAAGYALARSTEAAPTVLIAHTCKGRGVAYMEGVPSWHGSVALSDDDLLTALTDLGVPEASLTDWLEGRPGAASREVAQHV